MFPLVEKSQVRSKRSINLVPYELEGSKEIVIVTKQIRNGRFMVVLQASKEVVTVSKQIRNGKDGGVTKPSKDMMTVATPVKKAGLELMMLFFYCLILQQL